METTKLSTYSPSILSQISHELRTPLVGVLGMAQLLSKTPLNPQQKEYLQILLNEANRLLGLESKLHAIVRLNKSSAL